MKPNRAGDLGRDAWEYMPEKFTVIYAELVRRGLAQMGSSAGNLGSRKGGDPAGPLRSERALRDKRNMDQVLRRLAREYESGQKEAPVKCPNQGCSQEWFKETWKFCPWCGTPKGGDAFSGVRLR